MDANRLFSLVVLVSCGALLFRARGKAAAPQSGMLRVAFALVVLDLVLLVVLERHGGYVVGALWALLVLLPALLLRRIQRAVQGQRYERAARLLSVLARLSPGTDLRVPRATFAALAAARHGEQARAIALLEPLASQPGPVGLRARAETLRIGQRWEELLVVGFHPDFEASILRDPSILLLWLRSLGECGRRAQLVAEFPHASSTLSRPGLESALDGARLVLFAFCGRPRAVEALLRERLPLLPDDHAALWLATALAASGDREAARALCERHLDTPHVDTRQSLAARLAALGLPSVPVPGEEELLASEEARHAEHVRYAHEPPGSARRAPFTSALVAVLLLSFGVELWRGDSDSPRTLLELGALWAPAVLEQGQWFRLLTFQLLHAGPLHLVMNVLALSLLGRDVERHLGALRTALVFAVAGTFGGVLSLLLAQLGLLAPQLIVGASGGIMGLIGATAAVFLHGHRRERSALARRRLLQALTIVALQTLLDLLIPQLSMMAHLSGALAGFVSAWLLLRVAR